MRLAAHPRLPLKRHVKALELAINLKTAPRCRVAFCEGRTLLLTWAGLPSAGSHQLSLAHVAVGTCVSSHAPRTEPYVRLSRIRLPPRVCDGESGRIRSSAFVTRARLWVRYVLCWCAFPLAPALRSTDSAAFAPADASAVGFLRFVRRLHSYYDEVRLLVSVHHWLRLLAFPMRTAVHTQHATTAARYEISQVPVRSLCT